jgi:hypothetical protein
MHSGGLKYSKVTGSKVFRDSSTLKLETSRLGIVARLRFTQSQLEELKLKETVQIL